MELVERAGFLEILNARYENMLSGEGHCIFVNGEAGIGKTSLIKAFCNNVKENCNIYRGTCDALFTPRPLAPFYDIAWQIRNDFWKNIDNVADRAVLFSQFFHELVNQEKPCLIIFEDIHWADEATLDFIKFLARRVTQQKCLFILSYRDTDIHSNHTLRNLLVQLPTDTYTRMQLTPLTIEAVRKMAAEKQYDGEYVYSLAGGNPFYVNEILASYNIGLPESMKDALLYTYNQSQENARQLWDILAVIPDHFETKYLKTFDPQFASTLEGDLKSKVIIIKEGFIFYKHDLFRRAVEASLSPLKRIALNKKILDLFKETFLNNGQIERIIHHAKNANEYDLVVKYAPVAARHAASVGAHIEASRLYLSAIEYYQGGDQDLLLQFYERYAYECYLTNRLKEAIIYAVKSLNLLKIGNDAERTGNCLRFLSRLWHFSGSPGKAELFANQAIEVLENQPSSSAKAMAYSNMSHLKIRSETPDECIFWGEKAIAMAKELGDEEILSHALNNVGDMQIRGHASKQNGIQLLKESLDIALKNEYHEHAARAYTNLGHNGLIIKDYPLARKALEDGIVFCRERDLDTWTSYLLASKARLKLEEGSWMEACDIADLLLKNEEQIPLVKIEALAVIATVEMRRGNSNALSLLLELKTDAFENPSPQRIIPVLSALLEYEWITGQSLVEPSILSSTLNNLLKTGNIHENNQLAFWLRKAKGQILPLPALLEEYNISSVKTARKAAGFWETAGCPYEQAMTLLEGTEDDKRKALSIVRNLNADSVCQKIKLTMRASGIKNIPRGLRKSTQLNPAFLTERELDVVQLLKEGLQNKEIAQKLFISAKTVDHHISSILFKLDVNSRAKAVKQATLLEIIK